MIILNIHYNAPYVGKTSHAFNTISEALTRAAVIGIGALSCKEHQPFTGFEILQGERVMETFKVTDPEKQRNQLLEFLKVQGEC